MMLHVNTLCIQSHNTEKTCFQKAAMREKCAWESRGKMISNIVIEISHSDVLTSDILGSV